MGHRHAEVAVAEAAPWDAEVAAEDRACVVVCVVVGVEEADPP